MKKIALSLSILFFFAFCKAQKYEPFKDEIAAFKKADSTKFPPKNAIVFVGSSSFTKWKDVSEYFRGYTIINRGFGGSTLPDVDAYVKDIVIPYHPKQVVIYCGDNDLASSDTVTAEIVSARFKKVFQKIRSGLPAASVLYVSIKPSPSRRKLMPKIEEANSKIKKYLMHYSHTAFADVYHPMLDKNGQPKPSIFIDDSLHMNAKGYAIWKKVLKPYLIKNKK